MYLFFLLSMCLTSTFADYWQDRDSLIKLEESRMLGSVVTLGDNEKIANKILMEYKFREFDAGFEDPATFAPARHFFNSKSDVEASKVFKFIQKMPKGAALHSHDPSIVSSEFLFNLTFRDHLYICKDNDKVRFLFMYPNQDGTCKWSLVSDVRKNVPNFDGWLKSKLTLIVDDPKREYPDIDSVWKAFMNLFSTVYPLIAYKPIFQEHIYEGLRELYNDNVMYLEFRSTLPPLYDLNNKYDFKVTAEIYSKVIEQFKYDHKDFYGARLIYGPARRVTNETFQNYTDNLLYLQKTYPNLVAGFDLVGQEDLGRPLSSFVSELQRLENVNFFFHAGETNWYGTSTDFNLVDALLLGVKRIGHGFALSKHPVLMKMVKERDIAVEVCPISNQVLMLVDDLRNHPAAMLMADGFPVVIGNDDPTFWSAKGLSYDFYMAFMGMASREADLKLLKQLSMNSLVYSAMGTVEKKGAIDAWVARWDQFIEEVIHYRNITAS